MFATLSGRTYNTLAYGSNYGWVTYPAASLSYVISEEGFFPRSELLSSLRRLERTVFRLRNVVKPWFVTACFFTWQERAQSRSDRIVSTLPKMRNSRLTARHPPTAAGRPRSVEVDAKHVEGLAGGDPAVAGGVGIGGEGVPVGVVAGHGCDPVSGERVEVGCDGGNGRTVACGTCHGATLKGLGPVPPLAGRSPSYTVRQLFDLQVGVRKGPWSALMKAAVEKMTIDDMIAIAAYLASR